MRTRRDLLFLAVGSIGLSLLPENRRAEAVTKLPGPEPKAFQSGDLLWPKKPGVFVPYDAGPLRAVDADEAKWLGERDRFVTNAAAKAPYFTTEATDRISKLSYREFYAEYVGAQKPDTPGAYSVGGGVYVGHVGIVEIDDTGKPWVIEALPDKGVIRNTYAEWITERSDQLVWLGRATKLPRSKRARIPVEAKKQLGKPYDFWNFDLNDDSGFYCSKLAWMAILRSVNLAIDGNSNPKRLFWFSPKQLLYAPRVARLSDPGPYATR